jgi:hypothetical protein
MKNSVKLLASVAFVAALGVAPALAQMRTIVKADIPFDFVVRGKLLPAGEYSIMQDSGSPAISVRNASTGESSFALTGWVAKAEYDETKLVFHLAGDRYYLASVVSAGEDRVTVKSKAEKEAESGGREPVVASIKAVRQ